MWPDGRLLVRIVCKRSVEVTLKSTASHIAPRDAGRRINVMIVASTLWIGGAESVMRHLAVTMDRSQFNVSICCLKQRGTIGEELVREGIEVQSFAESRDAPVDYFTFLKLWSLLRAKEIDVVHTHTAQGLVDACLCSLLMPGLRVVHTFHFGNYPHTAPRIMWMERIFSRIADQLFSVGGVQRKQIQLLYRLPDRRINTIYNGVVLSTSNGDPAFRKRVSAEDRVLIGTIATLIVQKGLSDLLDVAKLVQDSGRQAVFVIVGEGHLREELEAKRRRLGLEEMVVFTGWITNAAEAVLPTFDIFFQPSLWEAMSMVILEAMAAGKAVVATRVGENSHAIADGVDGLLVTPRDVDEMAKAINRLIDDAALRLRLGEAARCKVEQQFTVTRMVREYEQAYKDVMS